MPTAKALFEDSNFPSLLVEIVTSLILDASPIILDMSDNLCFIEFTRDGTLQRRWYLIQVGIPSTFDVNPD